jgi:tetratricopeptide (TPR) repeat protein
MTFSQQLDLTQAEVNTQVQKFYQEGDDHAFKGEHLLAIECYTLAIALDDNCVRAYCARGESSLRLKKYDCAERDFKIALKLSPVSAIAEGGLARTYYGLGNYPAALVASNRAIARDPENIDLYYDRALINKRLANYERMLADCKFILQNQPSNLPARWLNARAHFHLGNYKIALFNFDCYLNLQPDDFYAYYYRGICHERLENLSQAMKDLNRAISLKDNRAIFYRRRGHIAQQLGDFTAAMADFDRAIGLDPHIAQAYINRATIYLSRGDYAQALIECNLAIRIDPGSIAAYSQRGIVNTEAGNLHAALADYHRSLQLAPQDLNAYLQRGWILFRLGEYTAVMQDCETILGVDRHSVPANYLMGVVQSLSGFKQEAIFSFTKVMDANPSFVCALYHRGLLHHDLRAESRAIDDFNLAQEIQNRGLDTFSLRDETGLYAEGLALYHMNQFETARAILHQAAVVAQKCKSAVFHQQIAFTLEALGMT